MLEFQNVSMSFGSDIILKHVSTQFDRGKTHGIIGKNGSGKTVFLKLACGLLYPKSGKILVDGEQLGRDIDFPRSMGIIIEAPGFLSYHSGYRNLSYLASLRQKVGKKEVCDTMRKVGLNPDDRKVVGKYSLGMKQRLGIAQAIMENPSLLILDEPMNGLDKKGVEDIRSLLQELKAENKTIFLASHIKDDIELLCDTIYQIDDGELLQLR